MSIGNLVNKNGYRNKYLVENIIVKIIELLKYILSGEISYQNNNVWIIKDKSFCKI